jgi:hypothetical protein
VKLEQLANVARQRPVEVITEQLGDLPTLELGFAASRPAASHGHHYMEMLDGRRRIQATRAPP